MFEVIIQAIVFKPLLSGDHMAIRSGRNGFKGPEPFRPLEKKKNGGSKPRIGYLFGESRAADLAGRLEASNTVPFEVTRAEIFLTSACNMDCVYCSSKAHPMPEWRDGEVERLVRELGNRGTRHLQWTGGEVTIHPGLKAFVSLAKENGMANSISTNGTAGIDQYSDLALAGVNWFNISLDNRETDIFDRVTGTCGILPQIMKTIEALCAKRVSGAYRVVLNSVLTGESVSAFMKNNARKLKRFLTWCMAVEADDFKFLPVSTERLADLFPDLGAMRRFTEICRETVPERFGFFHYRLSMLERGGHGLRSRTSHLCYHCLDDRSYDSVGAFPCIIYLREGGKRLFRHGDSTDTKRKNLNMFFRTDRTGDPICRQFCFDVYRALSDRVASMLLRENER